MAGNLWHDLKTRQERIEAALKVALHRITANGPRSVAEAMGYSLLAPGKRLRPLAGRCWPARRPADRRTMPCRPPVRSR